MSQLLLAIQSTAERIAEGETVPVKKEFQENVSALLTAKGIPFTIQEREHDDERVFFKATE